MDKIIFEQNTKFYIKVYNSLIDRARNIEESGGYSENTYTEKHHIIPRSLGGLGTNDNLVRLTAREHMFAHLLLHRIYPDSKEMTFAVNCMFYFTKSLGDRNEAVKTFSSRTLERLREEKKLALSGENSPNFGKSPNEETREKMRLAKLGTKAKLETRIKRSNATSGKKRSEQQYVKVSRALKKQT